jgi:hypothetical protein
MISLFPDSFSNRNVAMVNINESVSTLTVTVDGDMVFNKTVPYGISDAIRQVINSPLTMDGTDVSDALSLLYSQNVLLTQLPQYLDESATEEMKLQYGVTASVVSLTKAIEQALVAYLAKENIQIQEFHLSGLGAGIARISQLMAHEFGIPVTVIQQEGNLRINPTAVEDPMLLSCYPCVGAAIDKANFFTKEEQAGGEIAKNRKIDVACMIIGCVAAIAAFAYGTVTWIDSTNALKEATDKNKHLQAQVQELRDMGVETAYNEYKTAESYFQQMNALYDETRSGNEDMTTFLNELESILPLSARIETMILTPNKANVNFVCENKFVAAGTLHLLRNMKTINNMECSGVAEVGTGDEIAFMCEFALKSTEQREAEEEAEKNENENGGNENEDTGGDVIQPEEPDKLLAESSEVNTTIQMGTITIGDVVFDLSDMNVEQLLAAGFTTEGSFAFAENEALVFSGVGYANENGVEFAIAEKGGVISIIQIQDANIMLDNGIYVGANIADVLSSIPALEDKVIYTDGFIILNNGTFTLVACADFDGVAIESIYLIHNERAFGVRPDTPVDTPTEPTEPVVPEDQTEPTEPESED